MSEKTLPRSSPRSHAEASTESSEGGGGEKKGHRKSHSRLSTGSTKRASLSRLVLTIGSDSDTEMKLSPSSSSTDSPKSLGHVYAPYNHGEDLYNGLRGDFDQTRPPFCFLCGRVPSPDTALELSVEKTGFKFTQGRQVFIHRPVFGCAACLYFLGVKQMDEPYYVARLMDAAYAFYDTH